MVEHFEKVFAIPSSDHDVPLVPPPPLCLFEKPNIDPRWYSGLMEDVTEDELLRLLEGVPLVSAPGRDKVSTSVWKLALHECTSLRRHVVDLFTACLRTSIFPHTWKTGVILPFVKDASKERTMNNIRPITLQSCLGKLFNKLLAFRLSSIFASHPILHPAQRGFVIGGTTVKCIDELLDAWEWSRKGNKELYTILYDIKQAYDSVQTDVLVRALHRLHLPPSFIHLIQDSLTGLESCVRTIYGHTRRFDVKRSLRQGDPLAPLLFVILMDALHDGLDVNPFTLKQHGCRLTWSGQSVYLASLGYADDTSALTNSLHDLYHQNRWVQYFMSFNRMKLNPQKCELVGRGPDGGPVSAATIAHHGIEVEGVTLDPVAHDRSIRYLGVHPRFDGCWTTQFNKSLHMIGMFTRIVSKFSIPISQAVYMFKVFLMPKLELALHYVHGPGTAKWIQSCNGLLMGCIKHAASSPLKLSHTALALTLGLHLPSWMEASVKVSELFLRINSHDARWGHIGRLVLRQECTTTMDVSSISNRADVPSRYLRAAYLAVHHLHWTMRLDSPHRIGSRHVHIFDALPLGSSPTLAQCSSAPVVSLTAGDTLVAHDVWRGWGSDVPPLTVNVYTDGSYSSASNTSAWSVVIGDQWLDDNFATIPSDEKLLNPGHVLGATLVGSSINCTHGVYPAELQAIARALALFPLSFTLNVYSDSQASIRAIDAFEKQHNERKRLRMSARPLLQLIHHLLSRRKSAGGSVTWTHVRAHTNNTDIHSVGNRLADYQANLSRSRPDRSWPLGLVELPVSSFEYHLQVQNRDGQPLIDDLRRTALSQLREQAMVKWSNKPEQGRFACSGLVELGRITLQFGTPLHQSTLVHVATNSIHYFWKEDAPPGRSSSLQQLRCEPCDTIMSIDHLVSCPEAMASQYRDQLKTDIVDLLSECAASKQNVGTFRGHTLDRLLLSLFPLPLVADPTADPVHHRHRHVTLCMIGAFTSTEASSVIHSLGLHPLADARSIMRRLRLLCLESIEKFYTSLKIRI